MNIPGSLLSAILPTSLPAVQGTAQSVLRQAARLFGEPAPARLPSANGPSEPISSSATPPARPAAEKRIAPDDRLSARLRQWLQSWAQRRGGDGSLPPVTIVADGVGVPKIQAPQSVSGSLTDSLLEDPDLIDSINAAARDQLESDPLRWMPGYEPVARWTIPSGS